MKNGIRIYRLLTVLFLFSGNSYTVTAQSWNLIGNAGTTAGTNFIGTTDNKDFVFKTFNTEKGRVKANGLWQFGATTNLAKIDSGGNLSFAGTAAYKVAGNKYAFQYSGNPNYGLFFNSTSLLYEFRTSTALSVFSIGANTGNGIFKGNLKIGAYTLPATDGTIGQVLQTNGTGTVTWQTVSGGSGANTALSNLGATAINTNLLPGFTLTFDLGSTAKVWKDVYTSGAIYHNSFKMLQCPSPDNCFVGGSAGNNNSAGGNNTFVGGNAGYNNTSGSGNTFTGSGSGVLNDAGNHNTFTGTLAGEGNTSGSDNTVTGYDAGSISNGSQNSFFGSQTASNNTGSYNSMFGYEAGYANGVGTYNSFFGYEAGFHNTSASYNSFFGINAGFNTSTGGANTFIGETAGATNSTGLSNTYVGSSAGRNATGDNNTFVGASSGRVTTTGTENVFTGFQAGYANLDGAWNVFEGAYSGFANTNGYNNTFIGKNSGFNNTEGSSNIMIGHSAGFGNTSGSGNIFIGEAAWGVTSGGAQINNAVAIGSNAKVEQSNAIVLGAIGTSVGINITQPLTGALQVNTASGTGSSAIYAQSTVSAGNGVVAICNVGSSAYGVWGQSSTGYAGFFTGNVGYTGTIANVSDSKFKENVQPLTDALSKIELLNAKTYTFKPEYAKMNLPKGTQMGFIAQDLEKVFPELVLTGYDKSMDATNPMEYKSVNYIGMIPVLTEAVKEMNAIQTENTQSQTDAIAELKTENTALKNELAAMKLQMQQFDQSLSQCCTNYQQNTGATTPSLGEGRDGLPSLDQNIPNPFSQNTIIKYYLPQTAKTGTIKIYSLDGVELKSFAITQTGFGQVTVTGSSLTSGVYVYTLSIDGKAIDTRQMILTKN